jgi:NAD(P)H-dependent FMN reductase
MKPKLHVVIASTRPGRIGLPVGKWMFDAASRHGKHDVTLVDLVVVNLPLLDEPTHPRLRQYTKEHTKAWSATVDAADAFVFVMPEYNYGSPPALLNALDYLYHEWQYKPVGLVSYGGVSGGLRSAQMIKLVATTLKLVPLPEAVSIPFVSTFVKEGVFTPSDAHEKSAAAMLDELLKWTLALRPMRG